MEDVKVLYRRALDFFADSRLEEASRLLQKALELDPKFADAYEALGIVCSRMDRLDEAIGCMDKLLEIDPDSVMAHTNLSVFYMKKGMKEKAEEEKAKATIATFQKMAKEKDAQKKAGK